jgi:hypothetical protein
MINSGVETPQPIFDPESETVSENETSQKPPIRVGLSTDDDSAR